MTNEAAEVNEVNTNQPNEISESSEGLQQAFDEAVADLDEKYPETETKPETETETEPDTESKEEEEPETEVDEKEWKRIDRKVTKKFHNLKKEKQEFQAQQDNFVRVVKLAKDDPVKFLQSMGLTINDWAKRELETPENKAISEVEKLKQELQNKELQQKKQQEEQHAQQYWEQLTNVVKNEFESLQENYTNTNVLIQNGKLPNFFEMIADEAQRQFDDTGVKPDLDDIFSAYETYYSDLANLYKGTSVGGVSKKPAPTHFSNKSKQHVSQSIIDDTDDLDELQAAVAKQFGVKL